MKIEAQFVGSAVRPDQFPKDRLPEIALAGRSNVGKSSLINTLLGKSGLARTSNTPGRTQMLNFYRVTLDGKSSSSFYFVDMPGYGFAKVSAARRRAWGELIDDYLSQREELCAIMQLVDMRHPPQPLDLQMAGWLHHHDIPYLVVGTKSDKIAKTKIPEQLLVIAEQLNVDSDDTLAFSAEKGWGKDDLWRWVQDMLRAARENRR